MAYLPGTTKRTSALADTVVHFSFNYADASGTYQIPLPAGCFVKEIGTFVSEAFTTSGSNASLTIGDSAGAANYMAANDVVLETIDTVTTLASGAGETNATGKYYATADYIRLVFTAASAGATAGKVLGYVRYSSVSNDGIPAAAAG